MNYSFGCTAEPWEGDLDVEPAAAFGDDFSMVEFPYERRLNDFYAAVDIAAGGQTDSETKGTAFDAGLLLLITAQDEVDELHRERDFFRNRKGVEALEDSVLSKVDGEDVQMVAKDFEGQRNLRKIEIVGELAAANEKVKTILDSFVNLLTCHLPSGTAEPLWPKARNAILEGAHTLRLEGSATGKKWWTVCSISVAETTTFAHSCDGAGNATAVTTITGNTKISKVGTEIRKQTKDVETMSVGSFSLAASGETFSSSWRMFRERKEAYAASVVSFNLRAEAAISERGGKKKKNREEGSDSDFSRTSSEGDDPSATATRSWKKSLFGSDSEEAS